MNVFEMFFKITTSITALLVSATPIAILLWLFDVIDGDQFQFFAIYTGVSIFFTVIAYFLYER